MSRLFLMILLMASAAQPSLAQDRPDRSASGGRHVEAVHHNRCPPAVAKEHGGRCPPQRRPSSHVRRVSSTRHYAASHVSVSHRVAQRAVMAPAPRVRDMSGYRTTVYVAPLGTPYPLTEPKPGDYLCTTDSVPLGTKVPGMHSPKPHPPCGYKWRYDSGKDKGYWWLAPDPNYGVRP